jgi:SP family general alpha glucoside:H+ symporter-like MFS transporter
MSRRNSSVVAVDPEQQRKMSMAFSDTAQTTADANKATQSEQNMTLMQGLRLYPKVCSGVRNALDHHTNHHLRL